MRKSVFAHVMFGALALATCASVPLAPAAAHEGEKMECTDTSINAVKADIQMMNDGEAKTTAIKEMKMAEDMMAKKDTKGCVDHLSNASEATEK